MLLRIVQAGPDAARHSEDSDRIAFDRGLEGRVQRRARGQIHGCIQHIFKERFEPSKFEQSEWR